MDKSVVADALAKLEDVMSLVKPSESIHFAEIYLHLFQIREMLNYELNYECEHI